MSLKHKNMQLRQKAYFEQLLKDRLALLAGKGIEGKKADKDPLVRKMKADVKSVNARLKAIAASEKLTQDLAKAKVDKAAAALKAKEEAKSGKPAKAEKAEKPKKDKGGDEGKKEKKPKPEKAPKPAPEGA